MATLSGRLVNLLMRTSPGIVRSATKRQIGEFRASNGAKGNKVRGRETFVLDVVGRKSGVARPVMLMLARRGDDLIAVGSYGGHPQTPNWYKNLVSAGEAHVEVGPERWAVDARQVEGDERAECWRLACDAYPDYATYQELTERTIPVAVLTRKP